MASTINASTSSGLVQSGDTSGVLQLQTNSGQTAVTIDTSQNVGIGTNSLGFANSPLGVYATAPTSGIAATISANSSNGSFVSLVQSGTYSWGIGMPAGSSSLTFVGNKYVGNAGTEYMRIDSSGNVGIGTTSPTSKLDVNGSVTISGTNGAVNSPVFQAYPIYSGAYSPGTSPALWQSASGVLSISTNASERMRIDSSGVVLVGTSSYNSTISGTCKFQAQNNGGDFCGSFQNNASSGPYGLSVKYLNASPNNTGSEFLYVTDSSTLRASIRSNGGLANYQANNANLSDERLKTDILPATTYLDKICSIPVVTFKYKDQTDEELNLGVIAQEVDKVAPELVDHSGFGEAPKGESPYLAIYQTDLQYALMKCIQEQQTIINDLKARITALEGAK